jgi:DNA polymerase-4
VQLKIRDTTFRTETRQCTLDVPSHDARILYRAACELLRAVDLEGRSFRLTGIAAGDLRPRIAEAAQLELLPAEPEGSRPAAAELQGVVSAVRERFGHRALFPAEAGSDVRPGSAGGMSDTREE